MKDKFYKIRDDRSVAYMMFDKQPPKGWFKTESEALEYFNNKVKKEKEERELLKKEAEIVLDEIEREFTEFQESLREKYKGSIYADGVASDDTGLDTYYTISTTVKGDLRTYEFTRKLRW